MEGSKYHPPESPTPTPSFCVKYNSQYSHKHVHFKSSHYTQTFTSFFFFHIFFSSEKTSILCWKVLKYLCTIDKISSHLCRIVFWKLVVLHKFNLFLFLQIMFNWSRKIVGLIQNFKVFCMGQRKNLNFV